MQKYVFTFGDGKAEGNAQMRDLLGGKGANLAEMNLIGIPVPPGFTITTEACKLFNQEGKDNCLDAIEEQVQRGISHIETVMNTSFINPDNPLLISVRSGARASMPGMMDTVLNLGLNDEKVVRISQLTGDPRFAWDSYRRLIQMFGDVVMGLKPAKDEEDPFEQVIDALKKENGITDDADLTEGNLKELVVRFKTLIIDRTGQDFPQDPWIQLRDAIAAVFASWNNERAILYRKLNNIPDSWCTAVNVQAMVYGNLGINSATGVAFTRNASTGEDLFNGEFLVKAQGEDVVAGIRTPLQVTLEGSRRWAKLTGTDEKTRLDKFPSLEELMPKSFEELIEYETKLENHYKDMQDIEFTIQESKLWILQTRSGKRTSAAMVRIAMDMLDQGMIDEETALTRIDAKRIDQLLHPVFDEKQTAHVTVIAQGLPASPGAATGQIVFSADEAEKWASKGLCTILVRQETSPEDLKGMNIAEGILTTRGGMTSHAAIVSRGMGKCCISGAGNLIVDYKSKTMSRNGRTFHEGDWISLNGTTGEVYEGHIDTIDPELTDELKKLLKLADRYAQLQVRANADTVADAQVALKFGAKGIGLARTEHMFFHDDQIIAIREMILADSIDKRRTALMKILPLQRQSFEGLFETMHDHHVTIRLLDPPLHEFLPQELENQKVMAETLGISLHEVQEKVASLMEVNPMLGHRGCRLGITYPVITEMQTQAIIEAALHVRKRGIRVCPEIMVPLIGHVKEFRQQEAIIRKTAEKAFDQFEMKIDYHIGTMIEVPRAALTADRIAAYAEFFSFGTNDLTQLTFGYSRDDIGHFLPKYLEAGILENDPFEKIDVNGVGALVKYATEKGRETRAGMPIGACGEHGGDPESINFFHVIGLTYVSCSPYRVPVARIACAQAAIRNKR